MANPLSVIQDLFSAVTPFSLQELEGFPYQEWTKQTDLYAMYESWYNGEPLEVYTTDPNTGKVTERYPIKINPLKKTAQRHAAKVMGKNLDSVRFAGLPFQLNPQVKKGQKAMGDKLKKALLKVFTENSFGGSFLSTCIRSQYLGGAVVTSKWLPSEQLLEIATPSPKEFIGFPDGANLHRLREAWIIKEISERDALALGYKKNTLDSKYYYIEFWSKTQYRIQVNNKVIEGGDNPIGKVPVVYIPHIRVDSFLGESIISETVKGVIKELNLRWADIGDAVSDDSHDYVAVRNINGTVTTINVGDDRPVLDLGTSSGLGTSAEPDMFAVGTKSASQPMLDFVDDLYKVYRRETNHPAVADGEDEGSQRSSLTLETRMAPLVDEAEFERQFWTIGILEVVDILLRFMQAKNINDVTQEMLDVPITVQWQSMLPRDRDALSTEAAVRSKNKITSNKRLNELFGDVLDVEEDQEQVKEELDLYQQPMTNFGAKPAGATGNQQKPTAPAKASSNNS